MEEAKEAEEVRRDRVNDRKQGNTSVNAICSMESALALIHVSSDHLDSRRFKSSIPSTRSESN